MRRAHPGIALLTLFALPVFAEPCFEHSSESVSSACAEHINAQVDDAAALATLGRELEIRNRYDDALLAYRKAVGHPHAPAGAKRGLIRVRRELRDRRLLGDLVLTPAAPVNSDCWDLTWDPALSACQQELAERASDPALHERVGDLLRSLGRPREALDAYGRSLALQPANAKLNRKRRTLAELVDLAGVAPQRMIAAPVAPPAVSALPTPAPAPISTATSGAEPEKQPTPLAASAPPTPSTEPGAVPAISVTRGRYRAVIFGNQDYAEFSDLQSPAADARAIARTLERDYGFDVSLHLDTTRHQLFSVLADLRRGSANYEHVLVYYAGHGYLDEVTKRGYWLPVDAETDNPANWVATSDITNLLAGLESRHAMVIADSCFSGTLTRTATPSLDSRSALLRRLAERRSRTILTSGGLEPVLDGGSPFSPHSVFADALLDTLDANDGTIEAGRLFVDIRDRVAAESAQTPQYAPLRSAGHDGGDFIFVRQVKTH